MTTSNPTLDDLTRALTNAVARNIQRDLSGVHDSDECDCEMCAAADEYEAREAQGVSKATSEPEMSLSGLEIAVTGTQNDGRGSLWADVATIRAAIADTLDSGWQCSKGCDLHHPWMFPTEMFPGGEEPNANDIELRGKFMDAVVVRLVELQSPPHNAPQLGVLCPTHLRRKLAPYSGWCAECPRESSDEPLTPKQ